MSDPLYRKLIQLSKTEDLSTLSEDLAEITRSGLAADHQRSNFLAAQLAARTTPHEFVHELLDTYTRLLSNAAKSDPGCDAKTQIVESLGQADYSDEDFFLQAIRYRQLEPVRGGSVDTAAKLRVLAAFRLTEINRLRAVEPLVELLLDTEKTARAGAARALATCGDDVGKHLLRLKLHFGDDEPEVVGEVCSAYLAVAGAAGLSQVTPMLRSSDAEQRMETALALGESRIEAALEPLQRYVVRMDDKEEARIAFTSIALLQTSESADYLFELLAPDSLCVFKPEVIQALSHVRNRNAVKAKLTEVLSKIDDRGLQAAFDDAFE